MRPLAYRSVRPNSPLAGGETGRFRYVPYIAEGARFKKA